MSDWNSTLYLKFERERTRAARDLLAQLPEFEPRSVFDLGCGPGNSTELLATAFPRATIVGIDYQMLAVARRRLELAEFIKQGIKAGARRKARTSSSPMRRCNLCRTIMSLCPVSSRF